jgi:hypothetical protein
MQMLFQTNNGGQNNFGGFNNINPTNSAQQPPFNATNPVLTTQNPNEA